MDEILPDSCILDRTTSCGYVRLDAMHFAIADDVASSTAFKESTGFDTWCAARRFSSS